MSFKEPNLLQSLDAKPLPENIKIFIAIPCYGGITSETFTSMIALQGWLARNNVYAKISTLNGSLITLLRNTFVSMFLDDSENLTHLFFLDSDIGFHPEHVERLLKFDAHLSCGIYPRKKVFWDRVKSEVIANPEISNEDLEAKSVIYDTNFVNFNGNPTKSESGFCEILNAGTGFMMIKREVFEIMKQKYPERQYEPSQIVNSGSHKSQNCYNFFDTGFIPHENNKNFYSEDYYFCSLWRNCGGKIYADYTQNLWHAGVMTFHGKLSLYAE
ncbi:MAG: hypothetical protein R3Y52_00370 [Psittacicella sp.]